MAIKELLQVMIESNKLGKVVKREDSHNYSIVFQPSNNSTSFTDVLNAMRKEAGIHITRTDMNCNQIGFMQEHCKCLLDFRYIKNNKCLVTIREEPLLG
ncbi:hypothetical protein [Acetivibrio ethanolgignens]|uniref:Uncharacterized protein n=1 Tax=Acetivibrio ethanolgignens TaxID=290052 RepID=A0A0V8QEX5_9FIRM|nr:hypothetical protein [Acetivibrio ethanolgignens]KSV59137.1 hypothetical protein ASU35_10280 [Acetivibrio ethanolgignens]